MHEPIDLTPEECVQVLQSGVTGRLAVCTPDGPHIVPVNYSVVDDYLVVNTAPYSLVGTHARGNVVAFEVDGIDHERQRGWSVLVRGRAESVSDPDELDHIRSAWAPRPWAAGTRTLTLRVPWTEISGRRLGRGWDLTEALPVRRRV